MKIVPKFADARKQDGLWRGDRRVVVGLDAATGKPVWLPFEFFIEALVHIRGIPGSGKSSRLLLVLILQILNLSPTDPILIIDFGCDQGLLHALRMAAISLGRKFRILSLDPRDDSDFLDPFQTASTGGDVIHVATLLIRAFNMDYGLFYGGDYFTSQNLVALLRVAQKLVAQHLSGEPLAVDDVCRHLAALKVRDANQIRATFEFLNQFRQLKPHLAVNRDRVIDIRRAIDQGEIVYCFLNSTSQSVSARAIAGLMLYSWQQVAEQRLREGLAKRNSWLYVDEWPEIAGRSMERFISTSRKAGINLCLVNQQNSQLKNRDIDLHSVVFSTAKLKMYFNFQGEEEISELMTLSKSATRMLHSYSTSESTGNSLAQSSGTSTGITWDDAGWFLASRPDSHTRSVTEGHSETRSQGESTGVTATEHIMPVLDVNDVLEVDAVEGRFFLMVRNGQGHQQPLAVDGQHVIPRDLYERYQNLPLPQRPKHPEDMYGYAIPSGSPQRSSRRLKKKEPMPKLQDPGRRSLLVDLWQRVEAALGSLSVSPEKTTDP